MLHLKRKFSNLGIKQKLQLLNLSICFSFLLILLIIVFAFANLRKLSVDVSIRDTRMIVKSSQTSRQLVEIFSDIDLLSNTFHGKDTYLQVAGNGLISRLANLSATTDSLPLKKALTDLSSDFGSFLSQCANINTIIQTGEIIDFETIEELNKLENLIGELLLELTLEKGDLTFIEQSLMLVVSYHESFMEIGKIFNAVKEKHFLIHSDEKPTLLLNAIDDLLLRFQMIISSKADIERHGRNITRHVQQYRDIVLKFHDATVDLGKQAVALNKSKTLTLTVLENIERKLSESSQIISKDIERIIIISGLAVLLLTISVVIILLFTTVNLIKTSINAPMKKVLSGIKLFGNDNFEARICIDRKDEWDDIEKGFNSMASNLQESYRALKDRELELKESKLFLNSIFENIPDMIFVKDADELRFVRLNKAGEELLGYPKESFIGKNDFDFFPENEAVFFIEKDREVLRDKKLIDIPQERIQTKNKGERLLHTKKIPILNKDGHPLFLIGISQDITEIKKLEAELIHTEKLSAIGGLSASIAHEFNNPLQGIMNVIKGVRQRASLDEEDTALVDQAIIECVRMKNLIKGLQDFNRPSSGRMTFMDIHSTIDSILLLCKREFKTKGATIETDFAKYFPKIKAIEDQIKQVLLNIFNNAVYACKEGCKMTITTEMAGKDNITIRVQDTGVGINPDHLDKVFDPFFTTKSDKKGTGLGLPISYGIIKRHGGRIDLTSESGKGTTVTITLPIKGVKNA